MQFINAREDHYSQIANMVSSPEELYLVYPSGQYPWDVEQLKKLAKVRSDFTVCEWDREVVAFANLYDVIPSKSAFIGNVIVHKNHRGKGIGKALTLHMIQLIKARYNAVARLSVFGFNSKALLMYSELGFSPYAIEPRKNLKGETVALIHMSFSQQS